MSTEHGGSPRDGELAEQDFDGTYWESHWVAATDHSRRPPVSPYLPAETAHLAVGTALDAGCGSGTEVLWLAERGWQVTGADISTTALSAAEHRAEEAGLAGRVEWVRADVTAWEPGRTWDLVVTSYAHPDAGQLALYERIGRWVAPGGTLLIVAHRPGQHAGPAHPEGATATLVEVTGLFTESGWHVDAGYESTRTAQPGGRPVQLHDVVVRARRAS